MQTIYNRKILLVDDEPELLKMIAEILKKEGFLKIITACCVREALEKAKSEIPEIFVLDVMLPDGDGFTLFKRLKGITDAPVLFLSAKDEDESRLKGLGLGADDYITKPFLPQEFVLRLAAVLRRTYREVSPEENRIICLGDIIIDMGSGEVKGKEKTATLTAKEYALLQKLNENRGRIVTVDSLCMAVWNTENMGYDNTLMVHMRRLREKIEQDPSHPRYLLTVRGLGYKLLKEEAL